MKTQVVWFLLWLSAKLSQAAHYCASRWKITLTALVALSAGTVYADFVKTGPEYKDMSIRTDLPVTEHLKNKGGSDGLGLCVFTSIDHSARWANEQILIGFRDYMTKHPGGGYPQKVDEYIPLFARSRGLPTPLYVQHTGGDPLFLELALKTNRMPAVTYSGNDGVYYRQSVAHMVNLVYLSKTHACILDNNYPNQYLWMTRNQFLERWKGMGGGWAVVLLRCGPPAIPYNINQQYVHNLLDESQTQFVQSNPIQFVPSMYVNHGVDINRVPQNKAYFHNGREVTLRKVEQLFGEGKLEDDSSRFDLTIVGDSAFRDRVIRDINENPKLKELLKFINVQDYSPDHWAVKTTGMAEGITLQEADDAQGRGKVVWRMRKYEGPEQLFTALRKVDPNYDPKRDPDPLAKNEPGQNNLIYIILAAVAGYFVLRKQEPTK